MPRRKLEALLDQGSKVDEREIIALRNEYLLQISTLAAKDAAAPLLAKAGELLKSRYWANSSWRERGKILDTVGFLLRTYATNR
ncbi:MAG TPA: hypothetical protein PL193_07315 [Xanthobacteraceae bacterium]|nr:hypothetical protein [Xanthobacteraceae bacterium]